MLISRLRDAVEAQEKYVLMNKELLIRVQNLSK